MRRADLPGDRQAAADAGAAAVRPAPDTFVRRLDALPDSHPSAADYGRPDEDEALADQAYGLEQAEPEDAELADSGEEQGEAGEDALGEPADGLRRAARGLSRVSLAGHRPVGAPGTWVKGEPYRPWFSTGESPQPWFIADPADPLG